jgi:hypothetical protein
MGMVIHQNVASFNKALSTIAKEFGYTIEYAALREAALMCRDAIIFTPPFADGGGQGQTKQAELQGKRAVARDINKLFVAINDKGRVAGAMLLNNLASSAKNGDFASFQIAKKAAQEKVANFDNPIINKIVADNDALRAYSKAQNFFNTTSLRMGNKVVEDIAPIHRRYKYISNQGKTRIVRHQGDYLGKFLVKSKSELNAYIKQQQNLVGKLKSGWWNVMQTLPKPKKKGVDQTFGRKGVAAYVKKFPGNNAHKLYASDKAVSLSFSNLIGNAGEKATANNVEGMVYSNAVIRMGRDLEQFLNRDVAGFNSGRIR